jgi:hypothetical protein
MPLLERGATDSIALVWIHLECYFDFLSIGERDCVFVLCSAGYTLVEVKERNLLVGTYSRVKNA